MISAVTSYLYSNLGSNSSLLPLAIKDIANSVGLTAGSYITGKDVESQDRFIDEFGTQAIWLGAIPFFKGLTNYTVYKALGIDPKFDVRNLKNKEILAQAIEKAPTKEIAESIKKAAANEKLIKGLALGKFAFATSGAIAAYTGLTKYRQNYRLKKAKEELAEQGKNNVQKTNIPFKSTVPQAFSGVHTQNGKNISFGGALEEFMFNPAKNMMLLDGAITEERLRNSESKQEFINYTIKEGGTWAFMYFAGDIIRKHLEKKALSKEQPTPISLDSRIIECKELREAFKLGTIKKSLDDFTKQCPANSTDLHIYNFIHDNQDNFIVKMGKKSKLIATIKSAKDITNAPIDTRAYLDIDEFKNLKNELNLLYEKAPKDNLDDYLNKVIKTKRISVLKNMGICIGALGVGVPLLMIAMRYILPNNKEYKVMEQAKKETNTTIATA